MKKLISGLAVLVLAHVSTATLNIATNGQIWGSVRTNVLNPAVLQINTNVTDIADLQANSISTSLWATVSSAATNAATQSDLTSTSNALVAAIGGGGISAATATNIAQAVIATSDVTNLVSGSATSGYVPTANGAGGIAWAAQSGGGGGTVYYPVSPSDLILAFTFDDSVTNNWWGGDSAANNGNVFSKYDPVHGNVMAYTNEGSNSGITSGQIVVPLDWSIMFWWKNTKGTNFLDATFFTATAWPSVNSWIQTIADNSGAESGLGQFQYYIQSPSANITVSTNLNSAGIFTNWNHYAMTMTSSGDWKCFLNGVLINQTNFTGLVAMTNTVWIGCYDSTDAGNNSMDMNNVYIYGRTLSTSEVYRAYNLESNGQYGVQGLRKP